MISIKTPEEIKILRDGGKILASVLLKAGEKVKPGVASIELDELAEFLIKKAGAKPSFKNYKTRDDKFPFPASICVSINDEVVHGIPAEDRFFQEGDVVGLDLGLKWRGLYTDAATTVVAGKASSETEKLLKVSKAALGKGIEVIRENAPLGDIGFAIQSYVEASGFNVIKKLVGHGVGRAVHEDPEIPNWGKKGEGIVLKEGMVLAIEPMVATGSGDVYLDKNGWIWKTKDGSLAAHFEHTIVVTKKGAEILTSL